MHFLLWVRVFLIDVFPEFSGLGFSTGVFKVVQDLEGIRGLTGLGVQGGLEGC